MCSMDRRQLVPQDLLSNGLGKIHGLSTDLGMEAHGEHLGQSRGIYVDIRVDIGLFGKGRGLLTC